MAGLQLAHPEFRFGYLPRILSSVFKPTHDLVVGDQSTIAESFVVMYGLHAGHGDRPAGERTVNRVGIAAANHVDVVGGGVNRAGESAVAGNFDAAGSDRRAIGVGRAVDPVKLEI